MIEHPRQLFLTTELDPSLLSAPFEIQTNWHVITGAPCSGKTTLVELLARKGFRTVPEVGRQYVEQEIARGRALGEIRADGAAFNVVIRKLTLALERRLGPEDSMFLDRGLPDCLAFHRQYGMDPNEMLPECFQYRYASVFVLDRFPTRKDCARVEDDVAAEFLDSWLARDYSSLGYHVVRVPALSPDGRLAFVLENLAEQGLT
jgi:predicted ATPase